MKPSGAFRLLAEPHAVTRACSIPNGKKHHFLYLVMRYAQPTQKHQLIQVWMLNTEIVA